MEFGNRGREHRPVLPRMISDREKKKAEIRAELLAREERRILEEEVRKELGWERGIRFDLEREETPVAPLSLAPLWDKFYDYEPELQGLRRHRIGSVDQRRRTVDDACSDVGSEISRALREAKKAMIKVELLERKERRVLEEEVTRELDLERGITSCCCHGEREETPPVDADCTDVGFENSRSLRDDGDLVLGLGFEGYHLRASPRLRHPVERWVFSPQEKDACHAVRRSVSPQEENVQTLPSFPEFISLNCVEPDLNSTPSVVVADSASKPCVEPVPSPKPSPMVIGVVYAPEPGLPELSSVPENAPSSNDCSGNKRKFAAFACDLCQVTTTSKESLDGHFNGKRHKAAIASNQRTNISASKPEKKHFDKPKNNITKNRPTEFLCKVCGLKFGSRSLLNHHLSEQRHWRNSFGN